MGMFFGVVLIGRDCDRCLSVLVVSADTMQIDDQLFNEPRRTEPGSHKYAPFMHAYLLWHPGEGRCNALNPHNTAAASLWLH
jgi:hypothetical protein